MKDAEAGTREEGVAARWCVRLAGDTYDLEELTAMFTSPDLRVVREGEGFFLESASFERLGTSADVHAEARRVMPILNGAAKVKQPQFRDVEVDVYVMEFTEGGGRNRAIVTYCDENRSGVAQACSKVQSLTLGQAPRRDAEARRAEYRRNDRSHFKDTSGRLAGPSIPSAGRPYTLMSTKIAAWSEAASSGPSMSP
jgi:hypothetical protein